MRCVHGRLLTGTPPIDRRELLAHSDGDPLMTGGNRILNLSAWLVAANSLRAALALHIPWQTQVSILRRRCGAGLGILVAWSYTLRLRSPASNLNGSLLAGGQSGHIQELLSAQEGG